MATAGERADNFAKNLGNRSTHDHVDQVGGAFDLDRAAGAPGGLCAARATLAREQPAETGPLRRGFVVSARPIRSPSPSRKPG
jgi:hypothetical protein